jgi:membrane protease subunit HflC
VLTEDKKRVVVDYFARYRIVEPLRFFQAVRNEESLSVRLGPIVRSQLRRVLGEKPMSRILTSERAEMMLEITKAVATEAKGFGVTVLDVRMKHVDLPPENSKAVFGQMQKQREQEAKGYRAEGDRDRQAIQAEADKQRTIALADAQQKSEILRGEGDAEATRIYNDAFSRDPQFFNFYRSMLALQKGLPGTNTTYVGPAVGDFFQFFGSEQGTAAEPAKSGQ